MLSGQLFACDGPSGAGVGTKNILEGRSIAPVAL